MQVTPLLVYDATTVNTLVTGALVALVVVNEGTFPLPLVAPKPMASAVRDQAKVAPGTLLVKTTDAAFAPTQYVELATASTLGTGLTVMVNDVGVPVQTAPVDGSVTGVTTTVAVTGAVPLLRVENAGILPDPAAARPIDGLLLVQLKLVPATAPENVTVAVEAPTQTVWLATGSTVGILTTGKATTADGRQAGSTGGTSSTA